jgi:allantoicase
LGTKRNRTPNNSDWVIVKLAQEGKIKKALVDTCHFKGNYPDSCMIEGCIIEAGKRVDLQSDTIVWETIFARNKNYRQIMNIILKVNW